MRHRTLLLFGFLALAAPLSGCAINPATGGMDFMLVSHDEEKEIGRRTHVEVLAEFGGVYYDPTLAEYVETVGRRVALTTEVQNFQYSFTVLDTPDVNAFALPGGYVYVTRGLLALVSSEAELASVLSHELAHVNARHGAQRLSRMKARERFCETLTCDADVPVLGDLATIGARLALEGFSQDQEFEADRIGMRYLHRAGYDTGAMVTFLEKLKAQNDLETGRDSRPRPDPTWYSGTHPLTEERIARTVATAQHYPAQSGPSDEGDYLSIVDGMLYGNRPEYGFITGRTYAHPIRRITFTVPDSYSLHADSRRVTAVGPDDSVLLFEPSRLLFAGPMEQYLSGIWADGVALENVHSLTVNGMEAATGWIRQETAVGLFDFRLVAIRVDSGLIYRFLFATRAHMTERLSAALRAATYSFRRLTETEAATLRPKRLRVVTAGPGDTLQSLADESAFAEIGERRLAILNGIVGPAVAPGSRIKLVGDR